VPKWHPPPDLVGPFWPGLSDHCMQSGYHQIRISDEDIPKTAMITQILKTTLASLSWCTWMISWSFPAYLKSMKNTYALS